MARSGLHSTDLYYAEEGVGVPAEIYPYSAGVVGGALGGLAMAVVALLTGILIGQGPWYPLNLVAATAITSLQTVPPETLAQFQPGALVVGFILHMILSTGIGLLFALVLPTLPGPPWVWSLLIGPALWFSAQFIVLPVVNPVMSTSVWLPSFFVAHLVYGLVLGGWIKYGGKVPAA